MTNNTPTNIEEVTALAPSRPVRLDAWRWNGVATYDSYLAHVLRQDADRAARRAA
jgi:hypothetical protein